eukprot:2265454-Pleurochrysis_carterae.AAC.2
MTRDEIHISGPASDDGTEFKHTAKGYYYLGKAILELVTAAVNKSGICTGSWSFFGRQLRHRGQIVPGFCMPAIHFWRRMDVSRLGKFIYALKHSL